MTYLVMFNDIQLVQRILRVTTHYREFSVVFYSNLKESSEEVITWQFNSE